MTTTVRRLHAFSCNQQQQKERQNMKWYINVLKNYAVGKGRARRKEYWMFVLFNFIIVVVLGFIEGFLGGPGIIAQIYNLAVLVPSIAVGVRRMHDTDHSGWFLLIPIYNLILAVREGQRGDNRFGFDPKVEIAPAA
ncbi:MAG: uncharacterized membrane protein YhaH (DUF805 family) [Limisphaerales bacterium]|jgi:uncharacterized membrane protein YhaH (DUF805 family)